MCTSKLAHPAVHSLYLFQSCQGKVGVPNAGSLSINTASPFIAYQRRLVIRTWVERGGTQPSKHWLSRRSSLTRRVGVAVIPFQVWYSDSASPRKIRVRTVLGSIYRMHTVVAP